MSTDIFGRKSAGHGGSFSADDAILTFAGQDVPLLVQQFQVNYQQTTSMLFDLTSADVYFVRGRAEGDGSMDQIIGPVRLSSNFLRNYGDVCRVKQNNFDVEFKAACDSTVAGSSTSAVQKLNLRYVLFNRISFGGTAQNMLFTTQAAFMFAELQDASNPGTILPATGGPLSRPPADLIIT
jgi:hypothetical protein